MIKTQRWETTSTPPDTEEDRFFEDFDKSPWIFLEDYLFHNKDKKWPILRYNDPNFKVGEEGEK